MALAFGDHPDVLFGKAPLELVLCQIRFSPILALLDPAGVAGFQAALRDAYPEADQEFDAAVSVSPQGAALQRSAPVWRFSSSDGSWRSAIGVDFVALETSDAGAYHFVEFKERLGAVLAAVDRTVHPGRSRRIGLRKVNVFQHPEVATVKQWRNLLRDELLGLAAASEVPESLVTDYAEIHFADGDKGTLSVRHGVDPEDSARYRVDLDYWNERSYEVSPSSGITDVLDGYARSMTEFFHWCLKEPMYTFLEPRARLDERL